MDTLACCVARHPPWVRSLVVAAHHLLLVCSLVVVVADAPHDCLLLPVDSAELVEEGDLGNAYQHGLSLAVDLVELVDMEVLCN